MIDVYICEDNEKQRNYLKSQIENFITFKQLDMQITTVTDKASVILSTAREASNCGLYFLDIDLNTPETNGFPACTEHPKGRTEMLYRFCHIPYRTELLYVSV